MILEFSGLKAELIKPSQRLLYRTPSFFIIKFVFQAVTILILLAQRYNFYTMIENQTVKVSAIDENSGPTDLLSE
jgi:hypothetical protein